jgi:hypothetical protein
MTSFDRSPTTTKKLLFFSCTPLRMSAGILESLYKQELVVSSQPCTIVSRTPPCEPWLLFANLIRLPLGGDIRTVVSAAMILWS